MIAGVQLLTTAEVAALCRVTDGTVRRWVKGDQPRLPSVLIGGRRLVRLSDLERIVGDLGLSKEAEDAKATA